ncbi:hypothetical protein D3C85_822280 [compost metagenome]
MLLVSSEALIFVLVKGIMSHKYNNLTFGMALNLTTLIDSLKNQYYLYNKNFLILQFSGYPMERTGDSVMMVLSGRAESRPMLVDKTIN